MIGTRAREHFVFYSSHRYANCAGKGRIRTNGSQPRIKYGESLHRRVYGRVEDEVAGAQSGGQRVDAEVQNTETCHTCSCSEAYRVGRSETFLLVRMHFQWSGAGRSGG